jgi:Tfp pilus assembly protein PilV
MSYSLGNPRWRRSACRSQGIALIEVLVSMVVVAVGLLAYGSSVLQNHKCSASAEERGVAVLTLERFVERLRADTDWAGLYARLRPLSSESTSDTTLKSLARDPSLTAYAPSTYYADFDVPASLGTVTVLVQVPSTTVSGVAGLRENANAPRYGLPMDLNGDGAVDGNTRNADCAVIPVVVRLRWQRKGRAADEVVVATSLRGDR